MRPNRKQIEANLRNKMAKARDERIENLEARLSKTDRDYREMRTRAYKAERERDDLQEKVKQLEDWIERLHEFMGMNDKDREAYLVTLRNELALQEAMNQIEGIGWIKHMFGLLH